MSRDFNGTSDYLEYAGAVRTALPLTLACWVNKDTNNVFTTSMAISTSGALNRVQLVWANNSTVRAVSATTSGTTSNSSTTATFSAGVWNHGAAVFTSTTSRTAYLNGVAATTNTTSNNPSASAFNTTDIGAVNVNVVTQYFDGLIAEAGVWSVALTAAEIASLAKGMSPNLIRPASLVAYWPLIGKFDPEIDLHGRFEMTVSGAVAAEHPRVYMPSGIMIPRKAPIITTSIPVLYRQRQMQGMAA